MKILLWIIQNWDSLAVILLAFVGIVAYISKNGIKAIKEMAFAWYTDIEAEYGGGTGLLKRSKVAAKIYDKLPGILKLLLPVSVISKILEKGLRDAKIIWEENKAINSYIESTGTLVSDLNECNLSKGT